jgi:hypothetical protein
VSGLPAASTTSCSPWLVSSCRVLRAELRFGVFSSPMAVRGDVAFFVASVSQSAMVLVGFLLLPVLPCALDCGARLDAVAGAEVA